MWAAAVKLFSGAVEAWNAYQRKKQQAHDENNGRNLQAIGAMSETVQEAKDARKRDAEVDQMGRDDLLRELGAK
jgi:hypothetical protein